MVLVSDCSSENHLVCFHARLLYVHVVIPSISSELNRGCYLTCIVFVACITFGMICLFPRIMK